MASLKRKRQQLAHSLSKKRPTLSLSKERPALSISEKRLHGAKPFFVRPEVRFVEQENDQVIFYWSVDSCEEPFQVSICDLKTGRWKNLTPLLTSHHQNRFLCIEKSWFTLQEEVKKPLPVNIGAAAVLCKLGGQRILLMFGGENFEGEDGALVATSHFYAVDIDKHRWWEIPVPEDISPRAYGDMAFVENTLYIFGGKDAQQATFSVARFNPRDYTWNWMVRDRPYPPHVPQLGYAGDAVSVYNGTKIMLFPGLIEDVVDSRISFSAETIFLFDTTHHTFEVCDTMEGNFPSRMQGNDTSLVSSSHFLGSTVKVEEDLATGPGSKSFSVLIAAWEDYLPEDGVRPFPECGIWLINVSTDQPSHYFRLSTDKAAPQPNCDEPDLEKQLRALDISFLSCAVLTDQRVVMFGSRAPVDEPYENLTFDTCVEIKVYD